VSVVSPDHHQSNAALKANQLQCQQPVNAGFKNQSEKVISKASKHGFESYFLATTLKVSP